MMKSHIATLLSLSYSGHSLPLALSWWYPSMHRGMERQCEVKFLFFDDDKLLFKCQSISWVFYWVTRQKKSFFLKKTTCKYWDQPSFELHTLWSPNQIVWCGGGGGGQGGLNLPLPIPFNPSSLPIFVASRLFAIFRLQNIAQCYIILPYFSCFPSPWESRFPP